MKQPIYKTTILFTILTLIFTFTIIAKADEAATVDVHASIQSSPSVRPNIKAQIENRLEQNRDARNTALENRATIQTEKRADIKDMMMANRAERKIMIASTTEMFKKNQEMRKDIKAEMVKKMEKAKFDIRKNALVKELNITLTNLDNISTRIDSRITKAESQNRDMTDVKVLFTTAKDKLAQAKIDVAAFEALKITSTNTTANGSTTAQVDLVKPRTVGDTAIKSVKETRDALKKVVDAIAKAMGLGNTGSTTIEARVESNQNQ